MLEKNPAASLPLLDNGASQHAMLPNGEREITVCVPFVSQTALAEQLVRTAPSQVCRSLPQQLVYAARLNYQQHRECIVMTAAKQGKAAASGGWLPQCPLAIAAGCYPPTLMNFFFQILCGRGLRGPNSACWLKVRSYMRPDMVLFMLFSRSGGTSRQQAAQQVSGEPPLHISLAVGFYF